MVQMPEAPVNKDNLSEAWKHKIRFAGEVGTVQAVAESHPMNNPANGPFWGGILALNA